MPDIDHLARPRTAGRAGGTGAWPARDHDAITGLEACVRGRHATGMTSGAVKLADYPGEVIVLACEKCERHGRYSKTRLVAEHGPNMKLPDLRHVLASDCPRVRNPIGNVGCGAIYPELTLGNGRWAQ